MYTVHYVHCRGVKRPLEALVLLLRLAASTLLVSNGIRHWVRFIGDVPLVDSGFIRLVADGASVRGLAPQSSALEGIARSILRRGKWPGLQLSRSDSYMGCTDCTPLTDFLKGHGGCPICICVREDDALKAKFKPWWLLAALMVVHDERCWCRGGSGGDSN